MLRKLLSVVLLLLALPTWAAVGTPVLLEATTPVSSASSITSGSLSPTSGDLIVVAGGSRGGAAPSVSSMSQGFTITGSWTIVQLSNIGDDDVMSFIAYAQYSSGTGTVTATLTGTANTIQMDVIRVPSGFHTTTPVPNNHSGSEVGDANGVSEYTSAHTPDANSMNIVSYVGYANIGTPTLSSGWTALNQGISSSLQHSSGYAAGVQTTYGAQSGPVYSSAIVAVVIEIQEASSGATILPLLNQYYR